jgi:hypothetical protein
MTARQAVFCHHLYRLGRREEHRILRGVAIGPMIASTMMLEL